MNYCAKPTLSQIAGNLAANGSPDLAPFVLEYEQQLTAANERLARLEEVLKPFAAIGFKPESECSLQNYNTAFYDCPVDLVIYDDKMGHVLTVGDFRNAALAASSNNASKSP